MTIVAIYNMKGGVGKTTTAVNLSYLAATSGARTLLWDLDPQGASSFAFRVRPHVEGFGRKSLESGHGLRAAIRETDYHNLYLLPADFAYRKFERLLDSIGGPERLMNSLRATIAREFDIVFLDCPAGFSLLTEGIIAAADAIVVPTIPTVLSLRTLAQLIKWADRSETRSTIAAFFSMVDRRKAMHQRAAGWSAANPQLFMSAQIPYASIVEQMTIRRMPLAVFAPREPATKAFAQIWTSLERGLRAGSVSKGREGSWSPTLDAIESLVAQLESPDAEVTVPPATDERPVAAPDLHCAHRFDTTHLDLQRSGYVLELRELGGAMFVVSALSGGGDAVATDEHAQARIDRTWAAQILAGTMSPLVALERRLGSPGPRPLQRIHATVGGRKLQRMGTPSV